MNDKRFPRPVLVRLELSSTRAVATAWEALECLSGPWPIITGHCARIAAQSCRDALDGLRAPEAARQAFAAAAREAGVLVPRRNARRAQAPQAIRKDATRPFPG